MTRRISALVASVKPEEDTHHGRSEVLKEPHCGSAIQCSYSIPHAKSPVPRMRAMRWCRVPRLSMSGCCLPVPRMKAKDEYTAVSLEIPSRTRLG